MKIQREKLPIAALEKIDDLCLAFEKGWQQGQPPMIESLLPRADTPGEQDALLAELIVLDMDYRRRRGERPDLHDYRDRFPDHAATLERMIDDDRDRGSSSRFQPPTVATLSEKFPALDIMELIGAGGMGAVYKAKQKGLDRIVALKVLPEELGQDTKFALRFTREARTLARLNHPNIVSVFEFGHVDDTYYFLMEYVDGSSLREVVQSGRLKPDQALSIVPHLCDALQYAHDHSVVHRDIKPENILLSHEGQVKIADFGLSRLLDSQGSRDHLTATHQVLGTPRYMAPEQLEGSHQVDHRADIYSLGVVFYEMLTGELPIGRFATPSQKVAVDVRLDEVVLRTLEKEPDRRYQRASQIKSDVESIAGSPASNLAPTLDLDRPAAVVGRPTLHSSVDQQETAGRLLLVRRQLMERVQRSLRPLFWGQIAQMIVGAALIGVGVACWARNQDVVHRVVAGAILHVYGVLMVLAAGWVCSKIKRLDYSQPVDAIREQLFTLGTIYLRLGGLLGLAWWLLWIPFGIAIGFDDILHPPVFWTSLLICLAGWAITAWLYFRLLHSDDSRSKRWRDKLSGESLQTAHRELDEIATAGLL